MSKLDFKESYVQDFSKTPKRGKPFQNMPGDAQTIGKGIVPFKMADKRSKSGGKTTEKPKEKAKEKSTSKDKKKK